MAFCDGSIVEHWFGDVLVNPDMQEFPYDTVTPSWRSVMAPSVNASCGEYLVDPDVQEHMYDAATCRWRFVMAPSFNAGCGEILVNPDEQEFSYDAATPRCRSVMIQSSNTGCVEVRSIQMCRSLRTMQLHLHGVLWWSHC